MANTIIKKHKQTGFWCEIKTKVEKNAVSEIKKNSLSRSHKRMVIK